jgi:hypothetical protein
MRLPRLNRLTGLRWWRHASPRDDSPKTVFRQDVEISRRLGSPAPCAIGKIGTTELLGLEFFERWIRPPWPKSASWHRPASRLYYCSGLFPVRKDVFFRWAEEYRSALHSLDVVAQWQPGNIYEGVLEKKIINRECPQAFRAGRSLIHFFLGNHRSGWLDDLARLRWLVIHPFEKTIQAQLPHLTEVGVFSLSADPAVRQRARDTRILRCPQFAYMEPPRHRDWLHALEDMKREMERQAEDFDIALVGAGAWSLPLTAHAKKIGKKGMHLGGALQLLFGIKGGRFDDWSILYNDRWIRPLAEERPPNHRLMEQGAYW